MDHGMDVIYHIGLPSEVERCGLLFMGSQNSLRNLDMCLVLNIGYRGGVRTSVFVGSMTKLLNYH